MLGRLLLIRLSSSVLILLYLSSFIFRLFLRLIRL